MLHSAKLTLFSIVAHCFKAEGGISRRAWLLWGALVFLIPYQLHYVYILNHFYHFGGGYPDSGLFAHMVWHNTWNLMAPTPWAHAQYSFLLFHFMPALMPVNMVSYLLPTHMVEFYAGYMAGVYALFSVFLFAAFYLCLKPRDHLHMLALAAVAIFFAFNNIIMHGITYVHPEYAIVLGILFFLLFYVQNFPRLTWFFFAFTLFQREDAGLHLGVVMGLITLIKWWESRSLFAAKREITYTLLAIGYSVVVWSLMIALRPEVIASQDLLQRVYLGSPAFAHITFSVLWDRLIHLGWQHAHLWIGFIATAIWAARRHDLYLLVGFVANIPWFIINWIAVNQNNGIFYAYYTFPYIVSFGWPFLALMLRYGFSAPIGAVRSAFSLQVVLVLVALFMWNNDDKRIEYGPHYGARWGSFLMKQGAQNRELSRLFTAQFDNGTGDLGVVMGDLSFHSLIRGQYRGRDVIHLVNPTPPDTFFYMPPNPGWPYKEVIDTAHKFGLRDNYCMNGVPICMLTKRTPAQFGTLGSLFEPMGFAPQAGF